VSYLLVVVDLWAGVPGASLTVSFHQPEWGALYLALLGLVAWWLARRVRPGPADVLEGGDWASVFLGALRGRAGGAVLVAALALAVGAGFAWSEAARRNGDGATVHFLDVGQGDAALISTDAGHRILIDGGPSPGILLNHLGQLLRPWERTIDVVVLTHPQRDHFTGLVEVLRRYRVGLVIDGGRGAGGADFAEFERAVAQNGARRVLAEPGTTLRTGPVTLRALHPDGEAAVVFGSSPNDASLVFLMEGHGQRVLFTGDIEAPAEGWLLREGGDGVAATVLKVPHHGSKTSSTAAFLGAVAPRAAVVSAGAANPFGHPAPEVLGRLEGIPVVRTDLDGTLELRIDQRGARLRGSRPRP
jgi:competence protein ComEC